MINRLKNFFSKIFGKRKTKKILLPRDFSSYEKMYKYQDTVYGKIAYIEIGDGDNTVVFLHE